MKQISLNASEAVLRSGLPTRAKANLKFEAEKIVNKRRVGSKVEYFVAWKGFLGQDSWEPYSNLAACKDAIKEFDRTYIPPRCSKER